MEERRRLISSSDEESLDSSTTVDLISEKPIAILEPQTTKDKLVPHLERVKRILLFLLPSFISARLSGQPQSATGNSARPTAFLDGVRGVAAWAVFNSHVADICFHHAKATWGQDGENYSFLRLPLFKAMYKGDFAVALFFVISGFALSISPVLAMRKSVRDPGSALTKFCSAMFRRPMRLMIPSWASTFIVFFLIRVNFFSAVESAMPDVDSVVPNGSLKIHKNPAKMASFFAQLVDVIKYDTDMLKIFNAPNYAKTHREYYNGVLWTIKTEYQCSLILYLTQLALFPMRKRERIFCLVFTIFFGLALHARDLPLFWTGFLIAEYSQLSPHEAPPPTPRSRKNTLMAIGAWFVFLFGIYAGSMPSWKPEDFPFYAWMDAITPWIFRPSSRIWTAIGAVMVIWSIRKIPLVLRIYSSPPIQYLGKISFSLYVVHFWIVTSVGTLLLYNIWSVTGKESVIFSVLGFSIYYCIILFITIWVADLFWRCVDIPSVTLAKNIERRLFTES